MIGIWKEDKGFVIWENVLNLFFFVLCSVSLLGNFGSRFRGTTITGHQIVFPRRTAKGCERGNLACLIDCKT